MWIAIFRDLFELEINTPSSLPTKPKLPQDGGAALEGRMVLRRDRLQPGGAL